MDLNGKEQIEEYGMEPFIKKCKESVWKYKGMWEDFSGTVGFWADMDNPYVTYDDNFIESEWWALKDNLGQEAYYTRDLRLFLTALVVERRCLPRRLHRDTRQ